VAANQIFAFVTCREATLETWWATSRLGGGPLVLHSDNGSAMNGATMLATLQNLGMAASFSRRA
jgi:transposase InsO family protein